MMLGNLYSMNVYFNFPDSVLFWWAEFQKFLFFEKEIGFMVFNRLKIMVEISVGKNSFNVSWFYIINR